MSLGIGYTDPVIRRHALGTKNRLLWGLVRKVNPENQTMNIDVPIDGRNTSLIKDIPINNMITNYGTGIRQMPVADKTIAVLYKDSENDYTHIGYYLKDMGNSTLDKAETKDNSPISLLHRYLEEGELQISGMLGSEILMSLDGSVLIKNQFGAFIRLENFSSTLEGSFANLYYEMDGVRVRAGNVRRPAGQDTTEDKYVVLVDNVATVEDQVQDGDIVEPIKEFIIKAGTFPDPTNYYLDDENIGPTATFFVGDKLINEDGTEYVSASKSLNFLVKTIKGGGIAIDEDGSVLFLDQAGGTVTKFTSGPTGEKSQRIGNNCTSITSSEVIINHTTGSTINIDDKGTININHYLGGSVILDNSGLSINFSGGAVNISADFVKLTGTSLTTLGVDGTDILLAANRTAGWFDNTFLPSFARLLDQHTHAGPAGPVTATFFTSNMPTQLVATDGMSIQLDTSVIQVPNVAVD